MKFAADSRTCGSDLAVRMFRQWWEGRTSGPPPHVFKDHYRNHCRACRDPFFSTKGRDAYCDSCRRIIGTRTKELQEKLWGDGTRAVLEALECSDCRWEGFNRNRALRNPSEYLPNWAAKAHCHFTRHVFYNRFSLSKRVAASKAHHVEGDKSNRALRGHPQWLSKARLELHPDYKGERSSSHFVEWTILKGIAMLQAKAENT